MAAPERGLPRAKPACIVWATGDVLQISVSAPFRNGEGWADFAVETSYGNKWRRSSDRYCIAPGIEDAPTFEKMAP